jgi:hypothetical protein
MSTKLISPSQVRDIVLIHPTLIDHKKCENEIYPSIYASMNYCLSLSVVLALFWPFLFPT